MYLDIKEYCSRSHITHSDVVYHIAPLEVFCKGNLKTLQDDDMLRFILNLLPPDDAYVAGGYVANILLGKYDNHNDIDIFFNSEAAFIETFENIAMSSKSGGRFYHEYSLINLHESNKPYVIFSHYDHETNRNTTPIQLVKLNWFKSAQECIDQFDITAAQFAIYKSSHNYMPYITYNPQSMMDINNRIINIHKRQRTALRRIIKYQDKGLTFDVVTLVTAILSDLNRPDKHNPGIRLINNKDELYDYELSVIECIPDTVINTMDPDIKAVLDAVKSYLQNKGFADLDMSEYIMNMFPNLKDKFTSDEKDALVQYAYKKPVLPYVELF